MMLKNLMIVAALSTAPSITLADDWSLEPCINADVSSSGNFPTQEMEDQINAYLEWQVGDERDLYVVTTRKLENITILED